jgi:hypothetical protein
MAEKTTMPVNEAMVNAPAMPSGVRMTVRKTTCPGRSFRHTTTVRYAVSSFGPYGESLPLHLPGAQTVGHPYEIALDIPPVAHAAGFRIYRMDGERYRTPLVLIAAMAAHPWGSTFIDRNEWSPTEETMGASASGLRRSAILQRLRAFGAPAVAETAAARDAMADFATDYDYFTAHVPDLLTEYPVVGQFEPHCAGASSRAAISVTVH